MDWAHVWVVNNMFYLSKRVVIGVLISCRVILLDKIVVLLSFSIQCCLSSVYICWQVPLIINKQCLFNQWLWILLTSTLQHSTCNYMLLWSNLIDQLRNTCRKMFHVPTMLHVQKHEWEFGRTRSTLFPQLYLSVCVCVNLNYFPMYFNSTKYI